MHEVEACLAHSGFYLIPKDTRASHEPNWSIWLACDPAKFVGVAWRNNTGAARFNTAFVRFGVPGRPDFEGWIFGSGRHFGLEVKSAKGAVSYDQRAHLALMAKTGALGAIVRSYEDTKQALESWEIKLRREVP